MKLNRTGESFLNFREAGIIGPWIDVQYYEFEAIADDQAVLGALLEHWTYDHGYDQPRKRGPSPVSGLHGPYRREVVSVESFAPVEIGAARTVIQRWATQWSPLPTAFVASLEDLLDATIKQGQAIYELPGLGEDTWHEWGGVVGLNGFHEYVVISRENHKVALLVAADD